ncbi:MAG: sigma-70 family RNA polymerase sigma factor [Candidatus Zixiibacteriota bacterium]
MTAICLIAKGMTPIPEMTETASPPWFADGDPSDSTRRMADLERYAQQFFRLCAPRIMRGLAPEDLRDLQQEIILHLINDDFRVLRQYRMTGSNFDAWFCTVCINKTLDFIKRKERYERVVGDHSAATGGTSHEESAAPGDPESRALQRQITLRVAASLEFMDRYCRLLLRMAGEEFRPREMVRVLRWPPSKAKKVADDLKYCREKLRKLLSDQGVSGDL